MPKKIIEDALISAKEIEEAAMDNAKEVMLEAFSPEFTKFFQSVLSEGEEFEVDDVDDEEITDTELEQEGSEHDMGKEPDAGRGTTDPSEEAQDELSEAKEDDGLPGDQEEIDIDDDGDIDAKDLAALRAGKKDDDVVNEELDLDDDEEEKEEEPEPEADESSDEPAPEEKSDKELEVPEELFDDSDEESESEESNEDAVTIDDEGDEELDFDIEDDSEDSLEATDSDEFDVSDDTEEGAEEGLYIRKDGEFTKITPAEYLNIRKTELEEENAKLTAAIALLGDQLEETNLFNAKMVNINKLFESGLFTKNEKSIFVQQIDECDSIDAANTLLETTLKTAGEEYNPLDSFNEILTEARNKQQTKPQNIFESSEMLRMKRMAGITTKES